MLTKRKITVFLIILTAVIFLFPDLVLAQAANNLGVNDLATSGLGTRDIKDIISSIVNIALGFLGILAILIILYGGWVWMTSQGASEKIEEAKKIILNAVIGLVIILASWGITSFVLRQLIDATGGGNGNNNGGGYSGGIGIGGGVIESHYPARNATEVPRNTNLYITFKEAISSEDLLISGPNADCDYDFCAKAENLILIDRTNGVTFDNSKLRANLNAEHTVLALNPYDADTALHLGNANGNTNYNFALSNQIRKDNGDLAFGLNGYDWDFTISNQIDLTPPKIISVIPVASSVNARNTVVQINFSEAVNPLLATGVYDGATPDFTNIRTSNNSQNINGQYLISNQYRSVEFLTDNLCGSNSCGGDVYCLPANADLTTIVTDQIRDMADNQLDGDNDDLAGGNYSWSFSTNDTIDLLPPNISAMQSTDDLVVSAAIQVTFDKALLASSVNSEHVNFVQSPNIPVNFWLSVIGAGKTIKISHDELNPSTPYKPTLLSGIQDIHQNCWYPCACDDPSGLSCSCDTDFSPECLSGGHCETN